MAKLQPAPSEVGIQFHNIRRDYQRVIRSGPNQLPEDASSFTFCDPTDLGYGETI